MEKFFPGKQVAGSEGRYHYLVLSELPKSILHYSKGLFHIKTALDGFIIKEPGHWQGSE